VKSYFFSFSKINFYLEVESLRQDGFHNIFSYFIPLDYYDTLIIKEVPQKKKFFFHSNDVFLEQQPFSSLTLGKVPPLLEPYRNNDKGFSLYLEKRVPYKAGLGIASSNAVVFLKALNGLWECNLSSDTLRSLATKIGSDCAFFFDDKISLCQGKGDKITAIKKKPCLFPLWVLTPKNFELSTLEGYQKVKEKKRYTHFEEKRNAVKQFFETDRYDLLRGNLYNAFFEELKNVPLYQKLNELLEKSQQIGMLTGSGSSFFILFEDFQKATLFWQSNFSFLKKYFDLCFTIL
jgi:4-diphosphocytidyl-2-C-methyl-D-erythritol kinase